MFKTKVNSNLIDVVYDFFGDVRKYFMASPLVPLTLAFHFQGIFGVQNFTSYSFYNIDFLST
jgi:hypothetical protein